MLESTIGGKLVASTELFFKFYSHYCSRFSADSYKSTPDWHSCSSCKCFILLQIDHDCFGLALFSHQNCYFLLYIRFIILCLWRYFLYQCKIVILKRETNPINSQKGNKARIKFSNNVQIRKNHKLGAKKFKSNWLQSKSKTMYSTNLISPRIFNFGIKYINQPNQNLYLGRFRIRSKYLYEITYLWRKSSRRKHQS